MTKIYPILLLGLFSQINGQAQTMPLKEAIEMGINNYGKLKAENRYVKAAQEQIEVAKRAYLPEVNLSAQQSYGTINGQNGPSMGFGGLGVASSGQPLEEQNWKAAFGALYLVNVNWNFFNFGRIDQQVRVANAEAKQRTKNYEQEVFQQQVKIAAAYLNLLASQRLQHTQQRNLDRLVQFQQNVDSRVAGGLLPGVDGTTAAAEVAKAKITLSQIKDRVSQSNNELISLLGIRDAQVQTDTLFLAEIPHGDWQEQLEATKKVHPSLALLTSKIEQSKEQETFFKKEALPSFHLLGIYQARASGFENTYGTNPAAYSQNYFKGVGPTRQNYLVGVGAVFNLTGLGTSSKKLQAQQFLTDGLQEEWSAIDTEIHNRVDGARKSYVFALQNYNEAPLQVLAARQAYTQRLALYNNGLNELIDVTNAQYLLNRAEMDRDIAYTNLWQALLMVAASKGDFELFINEF